MSIKEVIWRLACAVDPGKQSLETNFECLRRNTRKMAVDNGYSAQIRASESVSCFSASAHTTASFFKFICLFLEKLCVHLTHTIVLLERNSINNMEERLPKLDCHVIDYFLSMAQKMEEELDDETYASVKRIFDKDVFMFENFHEA